MAIRKITKRWIFKSFGIVVVIMVAMVVIAAVALHSYYYNCVEQYIQSEADNVSEQIRVLSSSTGADMHAGLLNIVRDFRDKDHMILMAMDDNGDVILSSSGFIPDSNAMQDYELSLSNASGIGVFSGHLGKEKVMAVSVRSELNGESLSAMRYIVSLYEVDQQLTLLILLATLIATAILLFVLYTSSYFINSIIVPIDEVSQSALKIAQGDFTVRLHTDSDDEIGDLCKSINNMAEELMNSEQVKNDFISSVSHELRTPLTAIRGWGETLRSDASIDDTTRQKGMQVIMNETERLSQMVEELLDFSRIQGGRMILNKTDLDLIAELDDVVLMFTERARREEKQLHYEEPDGMIVVNGDTNRLRQVFINIIDNAIKYSDAGDSVFIRLITENGFAKIIIQDTGVGIASDDLPKVKDRFYKGKTTRRGSGIGLAVADEIIRMHNGLLDISSVKDEGTTVTIALPIVR